MVNNVDRKILDRIRENLRSHNTPARSYLFLSRFNLPVEDMMDLMSLMANSKEATYGSKSR